MVGISDITIGVIGMDAVATYSIDDEETSQAQTIDQICEGLRGLAAESGPRVAYELRLAAAVLSQLEMRYLECLK